MMLLGISPGHPPLEDDKAVSHPICRLAALLDPGFDLIAFDEAGVASALGQAGGVTVVAFCCDPRQQRGAIGLSDAEIITQAYRLAELHRVPIIGLWHSSGARLNDGVASLHGISTIFAAMTRASGLIPQISVILGASAGGAAYGPALTDVIIMGPDARVFVTGPSVIKSVTGEDIEMDALGGPKVHSSTSGVAHVVTSSDEEALAQARTAAALLSRVDPLTNVGTPGAGPAALVPDDPRRAYDVRPLVRSLLDESGASIEFQPKYAPNILTSLGRIGGHTVGVVANNPRHKAGCLCARSAQKAARFVRMCDAFGIPLVVLVDVPGYLPGTAQEHDGLVRRGASLLHAFAAATVPRITVITRKAFGGAYIAMNSRGLGATRVLAWPGAQVGVMGTTAAVRLLHRRRLKAVHTDERPALEKQLCAEYDSQSGGIERAVALGTVDQIISPSSTRQILIRELAGAHHKRGDQRNIPF